nr:DNA translocase FtsK [Paenibacillus thiaminolyticus]
MELRILRGLVNLIILIILWAILKNIWEPAAYIFVPLFAIVMFSGLNNRTEQENEAGRHDEQVEALNEWDGHDNDGDEYDVDEYGEDDDDEDEEDEEYDELVEDAAVIVAQAGYASLELLEAELDIDEEDAEYILNELEEYGIVDEASSDSSVRKVLLTPAGVQALVNSWHEYEDDDEEYEGDDGDDEDEAGWHSLRDERVKNAAAVVVDAGYASADLLQSHLAVDTERATELLHILEACHIVGPADGHRTERSVFVTPAWMERELGEEIYEEKEAKNGIAGLLQQLDALHGMEAAKLHIRQLVDVLSEMNEREDCGFDTYELRMNMIFAGLPGMGEMTIARIVGKILYEMDILYEGEVVEVPFCELLGSDPFTTSTQVHDALEEASGNVVVIPDLYRLSEPGAPEQGREAIHALLNYLDQCNEEIVVILSGAPNKLNSLLDKYIGIRTFFPYLIPFLRTATTAGGNIADATAEHFSRCDRPSFPEERVVPEMPPLVSPPREHAGTETVAPQCEPVPQSEVRLEQDRVLQNVVRLEPDVGQAERFDWEAELSRSEELHGQHVTLAEWAEQLHACHERKAIGMYADAPPACFVFKGGTESGRASLAQWLAGLYKHYGIVAQGHVVTAELRDIRSLQELNEHLQNRLQQAEGGLLVVHIHELGSAADRVQAERAVADTLMKATDKMNADKVIVIEGSEEEVKAFLDVSSVLRMRFSKQIELERVAAGKA